MRRAAVIGIAALVAGCGPSDGPVAIRTATQPATVCEEARISGTLVPDPSFGLALQISGERMAATWPYGYSARRQSGVVVLLDPSGKIVARQGDEVVAAGGADTGRVAVECDIHVNPTPDIRVPMPSATPGTT